MAYNGVHWCFWGLQTGRGLWPIQERARPDACPGSHPASPSRIAFTKTPHDVALEVDIPNGEAVDAPFSLHILVQDPRNHRCPSAERQDAFCITVESSEPSVAGLGWTRRGQVGKVRHGEATYAADAYRLGPEGMTKPKATTSWELIGRKPG